MEGMLSRGRVYLLRKRAFTLAFDLVSSCQGVHRVVAPTRALPFVAVAKASHCALAHVMCGPGGSRCSQLGFADPALHLGAALVKKTMLNGIEMWATGKEPEKGVAMVG